MENISTTNIKVEKESLWNKIKGICNKISVFFTISDLERQAFRTSWRICYRIGRVLRNLILLALSIVAIAFALQYVPNLAEHSPELMQLSDIIIKFFNEMLGKVFAYFA